VGEAVVDDSVQRCRSLSREMLQILHDEQVGITDDLWAGLGKVARCQDGDRQVGDAPANLVRQRLDQMGLARSRQAAQKQGVRQASGGIYPRRTCAESKALNCRQSGTDFRDRHQTRKGQRLRPPPAFGHVQHSLGRNFKTSRDFSGKRGLRKADSMKRKYRYFKKI
jgi:hypothetical protein